MRVPIYFLVLLVPVFSVFGEDYLRIREGEHGGQRLEIALRRFRIDLDDGKRDLLLVGVSHIGSADYYDRIQEVLDDAELVLFEGVDGHRKEFREMHRHREELGRNHLQAQLARALGLDFQLFALRYDREHFRNSDVSSAQLRALFNGEEIVPGADLDEEDMEKLFKQMQTLSLGGRVASSMLTQLEARPEWGRAMKWSMVMLMGNLKGDISEYAGIPPDMRQLMHILIQKRNEVVMEDVRGGLKKLEPGETLAVFYGAAHMADFERRFLDELSARVVETDWLPAFEGNLRLSGLNVFERAMIEGLMRQQLATLKLLSAQAKPSEEAEAE